MRVVFLGSFFSDKRVKEIRELSLGAISNANDLFQKNIIKGLVLKFPNMITITQPNIGSFPFKYKRFYFKRTKEVMDFGLSIACYNLSFINLPILKHFSRFISLFLALFGCIGAFRDKERLVLYVYDFDMASLSTAYFLKTCRKNVHVCLIVPDLPIFTSEKLSGISGMLVQMKQSFCDYFCKCVDSYSLITLEMTKKLDIGARKYTVVEGIYEPIKESSSVKFNYSSCEKVIFYSGSLDARNGIQHLVEAFGLIKNHQYKLVIVGDGPMRDWLIAKQATNSNIDYLGQLTHEQVLVVQSSAHLLVNPRLPIGDFTLYSFPSKTMEYLASGIPTLMYQLKGVPSEYFNYCNTLDDLSVEALSNRIVEILDENYELCLKRAVEARLFIKEYKNAQVQVGKIIGVSNV